MSKSSTWVSFSISPWDMSLFEQLFEISIMNSIFSQLSELKKKLKESAISCCKKSHLLLEEKKNQFLQRLLLVVLKFSNTKWVWLMLVASAEAVKNCLTKFYVRWQILKLIESITIESALLDIHTCIIRWFLDHIKMFVWIVSLFQIILTQITL